MTNTTFTTTDLTRLLIVVLGQLERVTAAARVAVVQKEQALAMARTLQAERDEKEHDPMIQPNDYQQQAARTLIDAPDAMYTDHEIMLVWNALGLAGEAGEVADTIKKAVFHRHGINRDELIKELGDVLWYVAALCTKLDVPMSEVMEQNIAKLKQRYPAGYSSAGSQSRMDVQL